MPFVPFSEWTPDQPAFNADGLTQCKNVIPSHKGYEPFKSLTALTDALTARAQGAINAKDSSGNVYNFAGDATKLYLLASNAWTDKTRTTGGAYSTATDGNWYFTKFKERILATNYTDVVQTFEMGTSTQYENLTVSTTVQGKYIATIRDFVVMGNINDVDGATSYRVRWSGINDPTDWTVSSTTQSDYNDLVGAGGAVTQVVGGEYGTIFQERAIQRMTYVGSPLIFQFDEVETDKGTEIPNSVIKVGSNIFYIGLDGFYVFDGQRSTPIGQGKVDMTFYNDFDATYPYRVWAAADINRQVIYWLYPGVANTGGLPNKVIMFNYAPNATGRWAEAEIEAQMLFSSLSEGYTLDGLDTVSSDIETLPFSLDSNAWKGGARSLSGFNASNQAGEFTGAALTAQLATQEVQLTPGRRTHVTLVRPVVDAGSASASITVQMGIRNYQNEDVTFKAAVGQNGSGDTPVRANAKLHRMRVNIAGGFNTAQGVDIIKATPGGTR